MIKKFDLSRPKKILLKDIFSFPAQCFSTGRGSYLPLPLLASLLSSSSLICSVCWMICLRPSSDIPFRCAWAHTRNARASEQNESSSRDLILSTVHEVIFSGVRWFILIRPRNFFYFLIFVNIFGQKRVCFILRQSRSK